MVGGPILEDRCEHDRDGDRERAVLLPRRIQGAAGLAPPEDGRARHRRATARVSGEHLLRHRLSDLRVPQLPAALRSPRGRAVSDPPPPRELSGPALRLDRRCGRLGRHRRPDRGHRRCVALSRSFGLDGRHRGERVLPPRLPLATAERRHRWADRRLGPRRGVPGDQVRARDRLHARGGADVGSRYRGRGRGDARWQDRERRGRRRLRRDDAGRGRVPHA